MTADDETHVVTAFLRNRGEVLLLKRSDSVGTYAGAWGGVSGYAEGDPDEQVRVEIREETGLADEDVTLVRSARLVRVEDPSLERTWLVHPFLFECDSREVELSEEHTDAEWVPATAILEASRETVPKLWESYERVAPTVRSIASDGEHGAAYLSVRGLEVLRDRAGLLVREREADDSTDEISEAEWDEFTALARQLLEARPSMSVLRNRVNRAMAEAGGDTGIADAAAVLESALEGIERALTSDERAAARASEYADGRLLTLSRSGTVLEALRQGEPTRVFVAESRPACEGTAVAEELAADTPVTLHTDAAVAHVLVRAEIDCVLVGADTVLPDGRVINKTGTRAAAIAATHEGIPVYAVAASDKISTLEEVALESGSKRAVYDGDATVDVENPTFDVTPAGCVSGVLTERGVLSSDEIAAVAEELGALEKW